MPSEAAKKAKTLEMKCCSSSVRPSQSFMSYVRSTSSTVQKQARACLYFCHIYHKSNEYGENRKLTVIAMIKRVPTLDIYSHHYVVLETKQIDRGSLSRVVHHSCYYYAYFHTPSIELGASYIRTLRRMKTTRRLDARGTFLVLGVVYYLML